MYFIKVNKVSSTNNEWNSTLQQWKSVFLHYTKHKNCMILQNENTPKTFKQIISNLNMFFKVFRNTLFCAAPNRPNQAGA